MEGTEGILTPEQAVVSATWQTRLAWLVFIENRVRGAAIYQIELKAGKSRLEPHMAPGYGEIGLWDMSKMLRVRDCKVLVERYKLLGDDGVRLHLPPKVLGFPFLLWNRVLLSEPVHSF